MTYIGTATSRVDGRAKVTGAAKYAAEYNMNGLATPPSSARRSPKDGSRASIPARQRAVAGVIEVLTHENRPALASDDKSWKDDVGPGTRIAVPATV